MLYSSSITIPLYVVVALINDKNCSLAFFSTSFLSFFCPLPNIFCITLFDFLHNCIKPLVLCSFILLKEVEVFLDRSDLLGEGGYAFNHFIYADIILDKLATHLRQFAFFQKSFNFSSSC